MAEYLDLNSGKVLQRKDLPQVSDADATARITELESQVADLTAQLSAERAAHEATQAALTAATTVDESGK